MYAICVTYKHMKKCEMHMYDTYKHMLLHMHTCRNTLVKVRPRLPLCLREGLCSPVSTQAGWPVSSARFLFPPPKQLW